MSKADADEGAKFPRNFFLKDEVTLDGKKYKNLHFRMPKGRDWTKWGEKPEGAARTHGLLADLAEVPAQVFEELSFRDHPEAVEIAESFFVQYRLGENGLIKQLLTSPGALGGLMQAALSSGSMNSPGSASSPPSDGTTPGAA